VKKRVLVLHHNDSDGFGAAYAAWCRFGDEADYRPVQYGDPQPAYDEIVGRDVYVLDFSWARGTLEAMSMICQLTVIDHHKTAFEACDGLDFCVFDLERSGCVLTWKYLLPREPVPEVLLYVEDRDLWNWQLDSSAEVNAALASYDLTDFSNWDSFEIPTLMFEGVAIRRYQRMVVKEHVERAYHVQLDGHWVPCVNATTLISEIGNALCQGEPFAMIWQERDGERVVSLRSDEHGLDVSEIAKAHGGGGHPHASGYRGGLL
jgi:oligoribonuclease NrnB/cAMP/cGMP phosphodiesterase (DHH superfamily)